MRTTDFVKLRTPPVAVMERPIKLMPSVVRNLKVVRRDGSRSGSVSTPRTVSIPTDFDSQHILISSVVKTFQGLVTFWKNDAIGSE